MSNEDMKMSHPVSLSLKFEAIKNYYFSVLDLHNCQKLLRCCNCNNMSEYRCYGLTTQ
jgi:hypothetical protein